MMDRTYRPPTDYPSGWKPRYLETGQLHVSVCFHVLKAQPTHGPDVLANCPRALYQDEPSPVVPQARDLAKPQARQKPARPAAPAGRPRHYAEAEARRARILAALRQGGAPRTLDELRDAFPGTYLRHDLSRMKRLGQVDTRICTRDGKPGHVAQYWPSDLAWPELPAGWHVCNSWGKQWQGP